MAYAEARLDHNAFKLQQDQELRRMILQAWQKHPGLVSSRAEAFLTSQQAVPEYYRLSMAQKRWMLCIADSLQLEIPEELIL